MPILPTLHHCIKPDTVPKFIRNLASQCGPPNLNSQSSSDLSNGVSRGVAPRAHPSLASPAHGTMATIDSVLNGAWAAAMKVVGLLGPDCECAKAGLPTAMWLTRPVKSNKLTLTAAWQNIEFPDFVCFMNMMNSIYCWRPPGTWGDDAGKAFHGHKMCDEFF